MASPVSSVRWSSGPEVVEYPSLKIRYNTCSTTRSRSVRSDSGGSVNAPPPVLIVCLARLMRCAIVASGTRKAAAIWAVVRPPTARKVERELRRRRQGGMAAQEEQRQRVVALGEELGVRRRRDERVGRDARRGPAFAAPPRVRAPELVGEAARCHRDQPRAWLLRHPLGRPLPRGGEQRFLGRILAGVELAVAAHERSEDLRRQFPKQILDARVGAHISSPPAFMSGRTSIAVYHASGICDARSLARSTVSQSTT